MSDEEFKRNMFWQALIRNALLALIAGMMIGSSCNTAHSATLSAEVTWTTDSSLCAVIDSVLTNRPGIDSALITVESSIKLDTLLEYHRAEAQYLDYVPLSDSLAYLGWSADTLGWGGYPITEWIHKGIIIYQTGGAR